MPSVTLRDYQTKNVKDALDFIDKPTGMHMRRLYYAPTGSGKGTTKLVLLSTLRKAGIDAWLLTPSVEIIRGFLSRAGIDSSGSEQTVANRAAKLNITTGMRLCNKILDGKLPAPAVLLVDEVHEWVGSNTTPGAMFAMAPLAKWLGWTATPYRGTPQGSKELHDDWGEPVTVLTLPECHRRGYIAFPEFKIIPLCDDDKVKVTNGELDSRGVSEAYKSRFHFLLETIEMAKGRPTMVTVSNTDMVRAIEQHSTVPVVSVTQSTKGVDREKAIEECRTGRAALIQIRALSRGFDLPELEVLIDAQPTLSPVLAVQTYGRVMRPYKCHFTGDMKRPEIWVTNRNLERHAHLFGAELAPVREVKMSQTAFGGPCARSISRILGLEAFSRFKMLSVEMKEGGFVQFYMLQNIVQKDGELEHHQFAVIMPPGKLEPIVARCLNRPGGRWGSWKTCDVPKSIEGYTTSKNRWPLSDKQRAWWKKSAASRGLERESWDKITGRQFQLLPLLIDIRKRL